MTADRFVDEMAAPHRAGAVHRERRLPGRACLSPADVMKVIGREERIDRRKAVDVVRPVMLGISLVRVYPQVDVFGELFAQPFDDVDVLAQADDADAQTHASVDEVSDLADERRPSDLGRMERGP